MTNCDFGDSGSENFYFDDLTALLVGAGADGRFAALDWDAAMGWEAAILARGRYMSGKLRVGLRGWRIGRGRKGRGCHAEKRRSLLISEMGLQYFGR